MESICNLRKHLLKDVLMVTMDLKDAYLHIMIFPEHQVFLSAYLTSHPTPSLSTFLVQGFTHGFHTGLVSLPHITHECQNLRSAATDEQAIDLLLQSELDQDFVIGPFVQPPFNTWRVSPIGLVKGKFSNKLRLVYDLSAPHSSTVPSLNSLIPSEEFSLKYASVDMAIQVILKTGTGTWLSKADISNAFKLLPIHPSLWCWHGIKWRQRYYFATKLTFGSKSSPWLFDTFAQALAWILLHVAQCQEVIHYLDDFLLIESPGSPPQDLGKLRAVFNNLNVPIAEHKVEGPSQAITFLGVSLDTNTMQASLPPDKLTRIRTVLRDFTRARTCTKRQLQSLLGMLNFAMRIIPQGRSFVSRLLALLSHSQDPEQMQRQDWSGFWAIHTSAGEPGGVMLGQRADSWGYPDLRRV
ncbi:uncharacterized protein LOC143998047 [Lithobates pipiens]